MKIPRFLEGGDSVGGEPVVVVVEEEEVDMGRVGEEREEKKENEEWNGKRPRRDAQERNNEEGKAEEVKEDRR